VRLGAEVFEHGFVGVNLCAYLREYTSISIPPPMLALIGNHSRAIASKSNFGPFLAPHRRKLPAQFMKLTSFLTQMHFQIPGSGFSGVELCKNRGQNAISKHKKPDRARKLDAIAL